MPQCDRSEVIGDDAGEGDATSIGSNVGTRRSWSEYESAGAGRIGAADAPIVSILLSTRTTLHLPQYLPLKRYRQTLSGH